MKNCDVSLIGVVFIVFLPVTTWQSRVNIVSFAYAGKKANQGNAAIVPTIDVAIRRSQQIYPNVFSNIKWISKASPFNGSDIAPCDIAEASENAEGLGQWINRSGVFQAESGSLSRNKSGLTVFVTSACLSAFSILGDLGRELDVLAISCGTFDSKLSDRSRFPSAVSFATLNVAQLSSALLLFMNKNNWTSIVYLSDDLSKSSDVRPRYTSMCKGPLNMLSDKMQEGLVQFLKIPIDSDQPGFAWQPVFWKISNFSRIVLLCTTTKVQRAFLSAAHENNMTNGDYVFISPYIGSVPADLSLKWNRNESIDQNVKKALPNVFIFRHPPVNWTKIEDVTDAIIDRRTEFYNEPRKDAEYYRENDFSLTCFESIEALADILNQTYTSLPDYISGTEFAKRFVNATADIETRQVKMSRNGNRVTILEIVQFDMKKDAFETVYIMDDTSKKLISPKNATVEWKAGKAPPDRPLCGLHGEYCIDNSTRNTIIEAAVGTLGVVTIIVAAAVAWIRRQKREAELYSPWWRVDYADLAPLQAVKGQKSVYNSAYCGLTYQQTAKETLTTKLHKNSHRMAVMNEQMVWTTIFVMPPDRESKTNNLVPNRNFLKFLRKMHTLQHRHINDFLGVCLEREFSFVEEYRKKGSIADMNQTTSVNAGFDWDMKLSFLIDLLDALRYLHGSQVKFHGNLKSTKCLLDNYFTLKLSDVGNERLWCCLSRRERCPQSVYNTLWTAPEVLRGTMPSEQSDIYAYGVIAVEILTQSGPFNAKNWHPVDVETIIERIRANDEEVPVRPSLKAVQFTAEAEKAFDTFLQGCWAETPDERYNVRQVELNLDVVMKQLNMRTKGSLFDRLMRRLNTHARQLEHSVAERTQELIEERNHCDMLLKEMLPKEILKQLRAGHIVDPEHFDCATVYFSSIVGFLAFAISSPPLIVIQFLNSVYLEFDVSIDGMSVYKVETISDSYMVCSGLPTRLHNVHAAYISEMALLLQSRFAAKFSHTKLELRVGINSGPVVAGVVGLKCPRYCLFGDTINTASRMESNGLPSKNHMSEATATLARPYGFLVEPRGEVSIKGKGNLITYWLMRKESEKNSVLESDITK